MKTLFLPLLVLALIPAASAQNDGSVRHTMSIHASGEVQMPADRLRLSINVNAEADGPRAAFDHHQELEDELVTLLKEFEIDEDDIRFQPMSINQNYQRNDREKRVYHTAQQVVVTISDFKIYEKMQVRLIEAGFDQFNGQFMTSEREKGEEKAIREAIANAKKQAEIIADEAGVTVDSILNINQAGAQPVGSLRMYAAEAAMSSDKSMFEFDQTVTIQAGVSITFTFKE